MNVIYDCRIHEVMGYAERGYGFHRGDDVFLMWGGYFSDLLSGMWAVYGWQFDPDESDHPHTGQVPLLREWNERGRIGVGGPLLIAQLSATAKAVRIAVAELCRTGPNLIESPQHGRALAAFLDEAVATGQAVSVEEWWG